MCYVPFKQNRIILNVLEEIFQRPFFFFFAAVFVVLLLVSRVTEEPQSSDLSGLTMEIHFGLHHPSHSFFFFSETARVFRQKKSGSERWNHKP